MSGHTFNPHDSFVNSYCNSQGQNILEACCCSPCIYTFAFNSNQSFDKNRTCPFLTLQSCCTSCVLGMCLGNVWVPFVGLSTRINHGDYADERFCTACAHEFVCFCCAPCAMAKYIKENRSGNIKIPVENGESNGVRALLM